MSLAKVSGTLYAILGVILGAIFSIVAMLGVAMQPPDAPAAFGLVFGVGAIILLPVFYGLVGFIGALITAGLYNWMARMVGGVQLDLE